MIGLDQGLPVATIFQIVVDRYDNFWLTSNRGVIYVKRQDLEAAADSPSYRLQSVVFSEADGMASAQSNGGSDPAALQAADGSIWVATARGVSMIRPDQLLRYQMLPPAVLIESVRVNDQILTDQAAAQGTVITLPADTRKLEFDYVSLSYRVPEQIRYRYRLQGFDPGWIERNQVRNAQYTNLPPGRYTFEVSAALGSSGWNPEVAALTIEILPKFWQRAWFFPVLVLLSLVLLWLLYRFRIRTLQKRERQLSKVVQERTQDLREKNTQLELLNKRIREQSIAFEYQARTDTLTALPNRRSMEENLAATFADNLRDGGQLCFALLDLDLFKQINDRYSHQVGDDVLKVIARVTREEMIDASAWPVESRIARWGGEEFALLFPNCTLDKAVNYAQRLRSTIEAIDAKQFGHDIRLTASIGVADATGLTQHSKLVSRADEQLQKAKKNGRNRVES